MLCVAVCEFIPPLVDASYRCYTESLTEYLLAFNFVIGRRTGCQLYNCIGNESVPIQLAQCRFPGLAISNAKILIYFSNKIYRSNFIKQHLETVIV